MQIDHIGIAVKSVEKGIKHWEKTFGYHQATEIVVNTRQRVRVVFLEKKDSIPIKLIEPSEVSSPITAFVRQGGGLHHLCFMCENVDAEVKKLQENRLRVLAYPQPGEAFENEKIAFVYAGQGLNIELIDTCKRAGRIPR